MDVKSGLSTNITNADSFLYSFLRPVSGNVDLWSLGKKPSSICPNGSILSVTYTFIKSDKSSSGDNPGKKSYSVNPFGYPNLPFPEIPLVSIMLVLYGMKLNSGLEWGTFWLMTGGLIIAFASLCRVSAVWAFILGTFGIIP